MHLIKRAALVLWDTRVYNADGKAEETGIYLLKIPIVPKINMDVTNIITDFRSFPSLRILSPRSIRIFYQFNNIAGSASECNIFL